MALRLSVFVQRFDVPSLNRTHPVNLATNQAKGADSPSVACSCCRAGCIERCSPRSTEAFESNPAGFVFQTSNPQILSDRRRFSPVRGRCGKTFGVFASKPSSCKVVREAFELFKSMPRGSSPLGSVQRWPGVGTLPTGNSRQPDRDWFGYPRKTRSGNSSTTKGE